MTEVRMMRSKLRHYINTGTAQTPVWSLLNKGVGTLTTNFNPETEEDSGIADESKSKYTTGLAPETSFDMKVVRGNAANDAIFKICWDRSIGSAAEVEFLTVDLGAAPTGTAPNQTWPAQKDLVNVGYNARGDEAVKPLKISVNLGHIGDPVNGTFNPTTAAFVAA